MKKIVLIIEKKNEFGFWFGDFCQISIVKNDLACGVL